MKTVILGQGAIGTLLAARCEQLHLDYAVMGRQTRLHTLHFQPLTGAGQILSSPSISPAQLRGDELLLLPLKAYQLLPAIQSLKPFLHQQPLLLLHNGMGVLDEVQPLLAGHTVIQGITRLAVLKEGSQVRETGRGATDLAWVTGYNAQAKDVLSTLLSPCTWHADLLPAMWQKLAVNAVINPLTALYQIKNGELAAKAHRSAIHQLCKEIGQLMQTLKLPGAGNLEATVLQVIQATADNNSSMYQDLRLGRRTEIDYINGFVCKKAHELGLQVPHNEALWRQIKAQEQTTGS